jgi:N-ethylmaleimide reductase
MAEYYSQRSGAGLIITEGTAPAPEALGYPRIPGVFSQEQVEAWKQVTSGVHPNSSKIFLQLMHTGRIGHNDNLPEGVQLVSPSAITAAGQIFTDTKGMQDHSQPFALSRDGIQEVIHSFAEAAKNAIAAGFDGVEIHGANGYLPEQFLNPNVNTRTDAYGGNIENRSRFTLQIAAAISAAIGRDKVGIRFSPFSQLGDLAPYDEEETHQTYAYLAKELNALQIAYLHVGVNGPIPDKTFGAIRENFSGTIILCNGLTAQTGEEALNNGFADLVGFGRSFLANPDFVERIEKNADLNPVDFTTLYTPGAKGYTDYPTLNELQPVNYQENEI